MEDGSSSEDVSLLLFLWLLLLLLMTGSVGFNSVS